MRWIAALMFLIGASQAQAGTQGEMCSVAKTINGRMVWVDEPCSKRETPMPCSQTTKTADGSTLIETIPCPSGQQKTIQQIQREEEAAQKKKCGKDFGKLRIGMALNRYEECTEALVFVTDTVSKGAVVETYRGMFYFVHAKDGRIVAFTRR